MHLLNLSTLRSKPYSNSKTRHKAVVMGLWIVFFLLFIDASVNILFPYPSNPQTASNQTSLYFNYGRSIAGKLNQMVGKTDDSSSAIAQAGWLDPELWQKLPTTRTQEKGLLVAVYGMSFSNQVGEAMRDMDSQITLRMIAAPAAPPSYSYAAYNLDRGRHEADVVVLGVLASAVKGLRAMSGATWQFESPAPYTYPKYWLEAEKLQQVQPAIASLSQLRTALHNQQKWQAYTQQLQEHDQFFHPFLFPGNFLDNFATVRLIRRAWAQHHQKAIELRVYNAQGFNAEYEIPVLRKIISEFASSATQDGKMPIVLLINDRGYEDHLYQALAPTLESQKIPYISTHSLVSVSDSSNFVPDGHFTKSANQKIAQAMLQSINKNFRR
ncbi:hypothetical protein [Nostoc sp. TCL26-01]|uniref:hypothetical protein n=1 Tax=Nostoc sp. TCL26-01 TaxID=2576904 RepID=UPI0015B8387A|nr:hypothetical protein [Nostoc sp. TCL26-01]QLE58465.1 hypothetical protein FD725_24910 [Nostoc sp. TCL26-01]